MSEGTARCRRCQAAIPEEGLCSACAEAVLHEIFAGAGDPQKLWAEPALAAELSARELDRIQQLIETPGSWGAASEFLPLLLREVGELRDLVADLARRARLGAEAQREPARMFDALAEIHRRGASALERRGRPLEGPPFPRWGEG